MRINNLKSALFHTISAVFLLFACLYMFNFYKCLSGFIANGFRDAVNMLPLILSFLLPVLCFLVYFYDFYVKPLVSPARITVSALGGAYAAANLAFIFKNINLYASNARFGVYDALPSIIVHFPYDMIIVHLIIIAICAFNVMAAIRPEIRANALLNGFRKGGTVKLCVAEYSVLCVLAIVVFVFTGAGFTAVFTSLSNAAYDFKYVYLILWTMLIPMMNLLFLVFKPEKMDAPIGKRLCVLLIGLGANLVFGALFVIFELTSPSFMVHIAKPLFIIAFSVSLPIEMAIILGIMAVGTLALAVKIIVLLTKKAACFKH